MSVEMYFDTKTEKTTNIKMINILKKIFFFWFILSIHKLFLLNNHDLFYLSEHY